MVTWRTDFLGGLLSGVSAPVRTPGSSSFPSGYLVDLYSGGVFGSPGTVDANIGTRFQYKLFDGTNTGPVLSGMTNLTFSSADAASIPSGKYMTAVYYLAPSTAFAAGVVPTPAQIRTAALALSNATRPTGAFNFGIPSYRNTAGDCSGFFQLKFMDPNNYAPNTKFWVASIPSYSDVIAGSLVSGDTPIGDPNVNGRALSLWFNRSSTAPKIKSPLGSTSVLAGSSVRLSFIPQDPDRIASFAGDTMISDLDDVAGVQVQFSAVPTDADPDPVWLDLPVVNAAGTDVTPGWWIDRSGEGAANTGVKDFMLTYNLNIRCAPALGLALEPKTGLLPSGDWRLRMRTFDWGHPYPNGSGGTPYNFPPLGTEWTGLRTPDAYPAANTSPWSETVRVSVSQQVPAPVAISPINNIAVLENTDVTLAWQYRNTYTPPFAQQHRRVEIREVGTPTWTVLVDENSASSTLLVSASALVSGNHYEWRVQVTDTSGTLSDYSTPARFWAVPPPNSGSVIPDPSQTIDGATLGCGHHTVDIYRRGGKVRVGTLTGVESVKWGRVRDDISGAEIVIRDWDVDCGELLKDLQSWAYEVVIWRDNGFSNDRVWEGPITLLSYETDKITIDAKDVVAYLYRRIIRQAMSDAGNSITAGRSVVQRGIEVIQNCFAPDDPNVLAYLQYISHDDDAKQYRSIPAYSRTGYEEVDDMAANAGLDYTAVGRMILLWGTKHRIGTLPEFTDADLSNSPIVSEYGMSMSNYYAVSDGNGVWGAADRLNDDDEDPDYGLVEMLSSTWASESESESGTYTEAGQETVRASFVQSAERSIASRYPPPVVVRVPDNTRLHPDTVISIQSLVPGVVIPLRSTATLRKVKANQKLDTVNVTEVKGEETITVVMSPFSRDDASAGEGVEV